MSTIDENKLFGMAAEALERTAFVMADVADEEVAAGFDAVYASVLRYSSKAQGAVFLEADEGFVREMAASLLGMDEDEVDPSAEGRDALNELANILGGSVISWLGGEDEFYKMHLPEGAAPGSADGAPGCVRSMIETESGALRVTWVESVEGTSLKAA